MLSHASFTIYVLICIYHISLKLFLFLHRLVVLKNLHVLSFVCENCKRTQILLQGINMHILKVVFVLLVLYDLFMHACACLACLFMTSGMKCWKASLYPGIAARNWREIPRNERKKGAKELEVKGVSLLHVFLLKIPWHNLACSVR